MEGFSPDEVLETSRMIKEQGLDVRTITMGISLFDCGDPDLEQMKEKIQKKIYSHAKDLSKVASQINKTYGVPIINKRITVTPISLILGNLDPIQDIPVNGIHQYNNPVTTKPPRSVQKQEIEEDSKREIPHVPDKVKQTCLEIAKVMDDVAEDVDVDFIGGFSALIHKGMTRADLSVIESLPLVLSETSRVCASINLGTTRSGLNMNGVREMGKIIKDIAIKTKEKDSIGCAKLICFANAVGDNPFMAGGYHGIGEAEACINVGISGPGVVRSAVKHHKTADFEMLAEIIKKTSFKITRIGQLVAQKTADMLGIPFGIVDLSLAPTTRPFDSVAGILEEMGLESVGAPGTTAALSLLTDAVKKGGLMASHFVGGLSGAFIPVAEDLNMDLAIQKGALNIEKLEAMTAVCSTGLDMICIPGSTEVASISGIIADALTIGVVNGKTIGTRLIPVIGKKSGERAKFGGLLGKATIIEVRKESCKEFIERNGRIPPTVHSFRN